VPGFGEKLKRAREGRDTPLVDVARSTRIGIQYLEALERGDFDGLPGRRGFGKLYIRVYAKMFGFDPEPVIREYDQERREHERPNETDTRARPERPRRVRFVPRARRSPATASGTRTPAPLVEEPAPDTTALRTHAIAPVVSSGNPHDTGAAAPVAAVVVSVASAKPADPVPVPAAGPTEPGVPSATRTVARMAEPSSSWRRRIVGGVVTLVVLGVLGITLKLLPLLPVEPPVPERHAATGSMTPSAEPPVEGDDTMLGEVAPDHPDVRAPLETSRAKPVTPVPRDPPRVSTASAAITPRPASSRHLEIDEFELGTGMIDHRPVEVRRDFQEGMVASFLTRVRGGAPGQTIHHAWIREGRVVQRIALRLGSLDWHTYSKKTLWGAGDWAVEARDESGRVLARIEFRCTPASGPGSGS